MQLTSVRAKIARAGANFLCVVTMIYISNRALQLGFQFASHKMISSVLEGWTWYPLAAYTYRLRSMEPTSPMYLPRLAFIIVLKLNIS